MRPLFIFVFLLLLTESASASIEVSNNITFETLTWNNIFDTFFANSIELTSNCVYIDGICYNSITFSNLTISETQIYQTSQTNTISVNINDSDGFISSASAGITFNGIETNYSMSGGNDTWLYIFRSSVVGEYKVTNFYATSSSTNSTSANMIFTVVPIIGTGGGSGSPSLIQPTPTSTPTKQLQQPLTFENTKKDIIRYLATMTEEEKSMALIMLIIFIFILKPKSYKIKK